MAKSLKKFTPPEKISSLAWGLKYRWLSQEQTPRAGKYSDKLTPWAKYILAAMDDPKVKRVIVVKSAQIGWTDGIWNTYLGRIIHTAACNIFMLFAKREAYEKYLDKKFNPSVRATAVLRELIDVDTTRKNGNRINFKRFPGGSLTLAGANSPSNIKSDTIDIACVEEPDDCTSNVRGQGDSVYMLGERIKLTGGKLIMGGTPTIKHLSRIENEYKSTDQRKFYVPCHECGDAHVLCWDNVIWDDDPDLNDEVYGQAVIESARYVCPHCGVEWDEYQKAENIRNLFEVIEGKPGEDVGFYINELYSLFDGSELRTLVKKYLRAMYKFKLGDDSELIGFFNNQLALGYEYQTDAPPAKELEERAEFYSEKTVPANGLEIYVGVDVQHDRLAIIMLAVGRGEEAWIIYWGEIPAKTGTSDPNDPVWDELDQILFSAYPHEKGYFVRVKAADIDSGDGQTNDAVYSYVRSRKNRGVKLRAIKGANSIDAEIVTAPRKVDVNKLNKANKYGLQVWIVGVNKVKDLLASRLKLTGNGPGRLHWYTEIRSDFYEQMTSEIKAPSRTQRGKLVWQKKAGVRNEAPDCVGYAIHASRAERVHLRAPAQWDAIEADLAQNDMFGAEPVADDNENTATNKPLSLADVGRMFSDED